MTQRTAYLLAAGLLLAGCLAAPASETKLVQKIYPVADLVIPVDNASPAPAFNAAGNPMPASACPKPDTLQAPLMKLIVASVAPQSWAEVGGKATIDYFPIGMSLIVSQTAEVHEQIAALLESLRRNAGTEVGVEVRVISISEATALDLQAKHDIDCFRCAKDCDQHHTAQPQVSYLSDIEVFLLFERLQGDKTTEMMQAPKLTMFNGQAATCQVMDYQWFVNNVQIVQNAGQTVFVPDNKPIPLGWTFGIQPVVNADEKAIRVQLDLNFTSMASATVPLFPITTFITPIFEGGAQGQPIPFTQFIQQPCVSTWNVNQVVNVPTGSTAVLSGWKVEREIRWDGPPVLSHIPFVKDVFGLLKTAQESRYMLVLVTPKLIGQADAKETAQAPTAAQPIAIESAARGCSALPPAFSNLPEHSEWGWGWCWPTAPSHVEPVKYEEAPAPEPKPDFLGEVRKEMAALLVRKYHQACKQMLTAEAKCIAEEALELDPTCFSNAGTNENECK